MVKRVEADLNKGQKTQRNVSDRGQPTSLSEWLVRVWRTAGDTDTNRGRDSLTQPYTWCWAKCSALNILNLR